MAFPTGAEQTVPPVDVPYANPATPTLDNYFGLRGLAVVDGRVGAQAADACPGCKHRLIPV